MYNIKEASEYLGVATSTLRRWEREITIAYCKVSSSVQKKVMETIVSTLK